MRIQDHKKSEDYPDMIFVGENLPSVIITYDEPAKEILCKVTSGEGEIKYFDVYQFFRLYGMYIGMKATEEPNDSNQMKILSEARSNLVHLIENTMRLIEGVALRKEYNLSGFVKAMDALIAVSKAELEIKLLESQVQTNESITETNKIAKTTNILIAVFTGAAAIWYLREVAKNILLDYFPRDSERLDKLSYCALNALNISTGIILGLGIIAVRYIFLMQRQPKKPIPS